MGLWGKMFGRSIEKVQKDFWQVVNGEEFREEYGKCTRSADYLSYLNETNKQFLEEIRVESEKSCLKGVTGGKKLSKEEIEELKGKFMKNLHEAKAQLSEKRKMSKVLKYDLFVIYSQVVMHNNLKENYKLLTEAWGIESELQINSMGTGEVEFLPISPEDFKRQYENRLEVIKEHARKNKQELKELQEKVAPVALDEKKIEEYKNSIRNFPYEAQRVLREHLDAIPLLRIQVAQADVLLPVKQLDEEDNYFEEKMGELKEKVKKNLDKTLYSCLCGCNSLEEANIAVQQHVIMKQALESLFDETRGALNTIERGMSEKAKPGVNILKIINPSEISETFLRCKVLELPKMVEGLKNCSNIVVNFMDGAKIISGIAKTSVEQKKGRNKDAKAFSPKGFEEDLNKYLNKYFDKINESLKAEGTLETDDKRGSKGTSKPPKVKGETVKEL